MKKEDFNSEWQFVKGYVPSLKVLAMYLLKTGHVMGRL